MRILVCSAFVAAMMAPQAVPPTSQPPKKDSTVQVRGCLRGQSLTLTEDPGFEVPGKRLDLKGDRRLMRALKEHDGHVEEIVGVLKMQTPDEAVAVKEKRKDKTRIYVGVSEARSTGTLEPIPTAPVLEVRAFSHVGPRCQ
jgi:hypothetical protein